MADRPTLTNIAGGASLDPPTYNANNLSLLQAFDNLLGRGGVGENSNSLTGDLDFNGKTAINLKSPALAGDIVTKAFGDAEYGAVAKVAAAASAAAAAVSAANALASENNASTSEANASGSASTAATDAASTAADVITTNADVVLTGLDVVATNADVVSTNADVVLTGLDVASTNADVVSTNADVVLTGLDVVSTNADVVSTGIDLVATNQDTIDTAADLVATNQDTIDTAADVVQTGIDAAAAAASAATIPTFGAGDAQKLIKVNAAETAYEFIVQGTGGGLDADKVDGNEATALLARANHTGTQALGTITGHDKSAHDALNIDADTLDSIDSAGFMQTTGVQTMAGEKTFTSSVNCTNATPAYILTETDAAVDNGRWGINVQAEQLVINAVNDANSIASNAIEINRTGTTVDTVNFPNGELQTAGNGVVDDATAQTIAGVKTFSDAVVVSSTVDGRDIAADGSKLDGIATGAEVNPALISQTEAEAGTATTERVVSAQRMNQAITALAPAAEGTIIDVQVFSASGTWTKPAGTQKAEVWVVGGGGGGGGCSNGVGAQGAGGGGAAYEFITTGLGATETVTVGAGGAGGAAGSSSQGTAGGTSSFGAFLSATGGNGGFGDTTAGPFPGYGATGTGNSGGTGTGGQVNWSGEAGGTGTMLVTTSVQAGDGGAAGGPMGGGRTTRATTATQHAGQNGLAPGGGAGGAASDNSGSDRAGGTGAVGIVMVKSYT